MKKQFGIFEIRGIDAWKDDCGWYWNDSWLIESDVVFGKDALTPRKIAKALREWGYLSEASKGRIRLESTDGESWEVLNKDTGEPVLALMIERWVNDEAA
jgi:hypothetical protein